MCNGITAFTINTIEYLVNIGSFVQANNIERSERTIFEESNTQDRHLERIC